MRPGKFTRLQNLWDAGAPESCEGCLAMKTYRIATIPGDGIGQEVVPAGIHVLDATAKKSGFTLSWEFFPWSCQYYKETGRMMPSDGLEQIRHHDAIFL